MFFQKFELRNVLAKRSVLIWTFSGSRLKKTIIFQTYFVEVITFIIKFRKFKKTNGSL